MAEGNDWVLRRHVITPAFSPLHFKALESLMVDSTKGMLDKWVLQINSGNQEIDVEKEITVVGGEIIAKASFGMSYQNNFLGLLLQENNVEGRQGKTLSTQQLVDECKTFFFGGHDTTALAITWSLMLLARHQDWQNQLREEIREVVGDNELSDINTLAALKKMEWVMNEVLRLYSPAPNIQRQARENIQVVDFIVPKGTNLWIDVVVMHHDRALWGKDVNEFKPERFKDDAHGGCEHKMRYLPFGFGGRMCIGRNLTFLEYKVVLTLILSRFSFTLSTTYCHSPSVLLTLRPTHGLPLMMHLL
ncbi:Cytochrome P450 [Quillaja saponaria]|uniref:Cytochrome P450 n=1 Tax=Quillaja saponaria TaxID=32244 RepID=A0AAD7PWH9_QUISA|nr:Cytochrome P450 [Quillaja saponaria]